MISTTTFSMNVYFVVANVASTSIFGGFPHDTNGSTRDLPLGHGARWGAWNVGQGPLE